MFYLLDKPKGITSFKCIKHFSRIKNIQKIGHTGTLDPLATGLLLIATDDDTKLIDYVDKGFKSYTATMKLGLVSDSYDSDGNILEEKEVTSTKEEITEVINSFLGKQKQMPPIFSAKRVNGKRAYDLARKGIEVKLNTSDVEVKEIKDIIFIEDDVVQFTVEVSRGTYIRSIIHDAGTKLGCGAIMTELRRITIGNLNESMLGTEIDVRNIFIHETIELDSYLDLINGKPVSYAAPDGTYGITFKTDIIGIIKIENFMVKPIKLFGNKFTRWGF